MIEQISQSPLCWVILSLAAVCYYRLCLEYINVKADIESGASDDDHLQGIGLGSDIELSAVLIGVLPLMGLLGTIIGLLDCFSGIASQGASGDLVSSGIAEALLTTQLGLVCAIPAWLLHAFVASVSKRQALIYQRVERKAS